MWREPGRGYERLMAQPVPIEYRHTDDAVRGYARTVVLSYAGMWGAFAAVALGFAPHATLLVGAVLLSRAMTPFHEYYHAPIARVPFVMRLIPVVLSPFSAGLHEQRFLHFQHHRYLGDAQRDPDHLLIHGPIPIALWRCWWQPERALWISLVRKRLSRQDVAEVVLRALLFGAVAWALGWAFLWYLIPARLLWMGNYFGFARFLHMSPPFLPWLLRAVYIPTLLGSRWLSVYTEHEVHHRLPVVRAEHLHRFRDAEAT